MNILQDLRPLRNFFDPALTSEGKPYSPERYKQIVKERYLISKHTHTSYNDTRDITPFERELILTYIKDDLEEE